MMSSKKTCVLNLKLCTMSLNKPSRQKAVIIDFTVDYDIHPAETGSSHERPPPMNKIADDIPECVHDFYLHSDNCWMAPGRKDYINVVRDGQKVQEKSQYLLMTTQELLTLYTEECLMIVSS